VLQKEIHICCVMMDKSIDYMEQNDNASWLNMTLMTPPSPCAPNVVGPKKLFTQVFDILNAYVIFQRRTKVK
jgi:hypothetical protein